MKLTVFELLTIQGVLPQEGNFLEISIKKEITEKVEISEKMRREVGLSVDDGLVSVQKPKKEYEVKFTDPEMELIKKQLKDLDEKKKLTDQHFTIYKKFNT